jgi:hypothetical protein
LQNPFFFILNGVKDLNSWKKRDSSRRSAPQNDSIDDIFLIATRYCFNLIGLPRRLAYAGAGQTLMAKNWPEALLGEGLIPFGGQWTF